MIEKKGNIWYAKATIICITTNGDVKKNGELVMGRGIAHQATTRYPGLAKLFGDEVKMYGNTYCPTPYLDEGRLLALFPVKHHWMDPADLNLIRTSTEQLFAQAIAFPHAIFVLPRPGCGNGRLKWEDVKPIVEILPDNVHIYSQTGEV